MLPSWLKKRGGTGVNIHGMKRGLRARGLHTVCEEARCPNLGECFERGTATFMIMGGICTRSCRFCAVKNGEPFPLDPNEPSNIAEEAFKLKLKHIVVTSVTRDDLSDGGASHFASVIESIRYKKTYATIEVLTPDFNGDRISIQKILDAGPTIFNHNVETVKRLTPSVRNKRASYERSLGILEFADRTVRTENKTLIKSGFMLGFGEIPDEIKETIRDLRDAGCSIITIGQYLQPKREALPVVEYVKPETFDEYRKYGESIGIKNMFCGPFVRSSYMAGEILCQRHQKAS